MRFTKVDLRQFTILIRQLNTKKEFNGTFADALKGAAMLKRVNRILDSKRNAYDYLYINIFKKYEIEHDELPAELDKFWESLGDPIGESGNLLENGLKKRKGEAGLVLGIPVLLSNAWAIGPIGYLAFVQYAVKKKWDGYKTLALAYAESFAGKKLNEQR